MQVGPRHYHPVFAAHEAPQVKRHRPLPSHAPHTQRRTDKTLINSMMAHDAQTCRHAHAPKRCRSNQVCCPTSRPTTGHTCQRHTTATAICAAHPKHHTVPRQAHTHTPVPRSQSTTVPQQAHQFPRQALQCHDKHHSATTGPPQCHSFRAPEGQLQQQQCPAGGAARANGYGCGTLSTTPKPIPGHT